MLRHLLAAVSLTACSVYAAEYFVSPHGDDGNAGTTAEKPFATLKRAAEVFTAGDTMTILPGVYHEGLEFRNFDGSDSPSTIRAAIPGTVVLRGDVDAPAFEPFEGSPRIWSCAREEVPEAVNERDTLVIYARVPSLAELDFRPAGWFYCEDTKRLYVQTSDAVAPEQHYLTISTLRSFGVLFHGSGVKNVLVEGLIVTGFNANSPSGTPGSNTKWGVYICTAPKNCTVRNVTAFLNGGGICFTGNGVGNVVEDCRAYGNHSPNYASGGNIIVLTPNDDGAIRNCLSFDSEKMGIRYYGGQPAQNCIYEGNISFDNDSGDLWMKYPSDTTVARYCVAGGALYARRIENCLFNHGDTGYFGQAQNSIIRPREENFSEDREFADPVNFDYRPQGDSPYRDRAPAKYSPLVFFVSKAGDDAADGHSVRTAWKSLTHAVSSLQPGATLYIVPGDWQEDLTVSHLHGVNIRGRGPYPVTIDGDIRVDNCSSLTLGKLAPAGMTVTGGNDVQIDQCGFTSHVKTANVENLRVTHSAFAGGALSMEACRGLFVTGNIFAHGFERGGTTGWSDRNAYAQEVPPDEPNSFILTPLFGENFALKNGTKSGGRSLDGMPVGPYWRQSRSTTLQSSGLRVLSATATTANIEFFANLAVSGTLDYGETPGCENRIHLSPAETFKTVSLTGLIPGKQYHFRISLSASVRRSYSNQELSEEQRTSRRSLATDIETFQTLAVDAPPRTLIVSPSGDDTWKGTAERPWRTIAHAATQAVAGDTVVVHGGIYHENIRVRATGDADRPLIFRSAPGEKVWIDGSQRQMRNGFCLLHKHHVTIDYFYFKWQQSHSSGAGILLRDSNFVRLSRCFYDGRGQGYSPPFVKAFGCRGLSIDNCFLTRGFSGSLFSSCPDLHVRNTVFYINQLNSIGLQNKADEKALFEKNIVVDNTLQKVVNPLYVMRDAASLEERDNCYFLRISPDMKTMIGYNYYNDEQLPMKPPSDQDDILSQQWRRQGRFSREMSTYEQFLQRTGRQGNAVFADPLMKALPNLITFTDWEDWLGYSRFSAEHSQNEYHGNEELDFQDFFTGNPELKERGIGLQQEMFGN